MAEVTLREFIGANRAEVIRRCERKKTDAMEPAAANGKLGPGVDQFLQQLTEELAHGVSKTGEIRKSATAHGRAMFARGFTVSQVVHDYGNICQSITDLIVELKAPLSADDFRTLNRCLDDAIAGAVSEYGRQEQFVSDGRSLEIRNLIYTAITAFEVLQTGNVGVGGTTGALVHRSLLAIRSLI